MTPIPLPLTTTIFFQTIFLKSNFLQVTVENTSKQVRNLNIHVSITEFWDEDTDAELIVPKKIQR